MGSPALALNRFICLNTTNVWIESGMQRRNTGFRMRDKGKQSSSSAISKAPLRPAPPEGYHEHLQQIGATLGWFLLRHLNRVQVAFEGDFVLAIVLGEIAHHNICHYYSAGKLTLAARDIDLESPDGWLHLESCNAYSLSNATGIPRETVRRKAAELVRRGWITRDEKGGFLVAPEASRHFSADFNLQSLADLLETADELRAIMKRDGCKDKQRGSKHP